MKRSQYTEEQIIGILKEQVAGMPVAELCCKHGMSDATLYKCKSKKRHVLVDTQGLLLHAPAHSADIQDHDGGAMLLATLFRCFRSCSSSVSMAVIRDPNSSKSSPKFCAG